ncbi:MAG: hypothetical protein CMF55_06635 [Legionellales bacterium]|nr:hypothetical protein [Legionellales bacterium]
MNKSFLIGCVFVAAVSSVQAGGSTDQLSMVGPHQTGSWYVGGGATFGAVTSFTADSGTDYKGNDVSWSAFVGRQVNDWLAFESGYTSIGDVSFNEGGNGYIEDTWSIDAQGVFSRGLYQMGTMDICGLLTTGVSYLNTKGDDPIAGVENAHYTGYVWTYGAGLEAHVGSIKNVTLRVDWRRYSLDSGWENVRYINDVIGTKLSYAFS